MNSWRTLMPNAWYITIREFRSRVATKSFLIGTILLAAIAFAVTQLPILIDYAAGSRQTHLVIVDQAGSLPADAPALVDRTLNQQSGTGAASNGSTLIAWLPGGDLQKADADLRSGKYDVLLVVSRNAANGQLSFSLKTDMAADGATVSSIKQTCLLLSIDDGLARSGTSLQQQLSMNIPVTPVNPSSATPTASARKSPAACSRPA